MKQTDKKILYPYSFYIFSYFLLYFFLSGCANQLPPTGGDIDRIPPEIEEVYPPDGTTNYDEDYFEIEFSEYVDKRSVREAVFISPYVEGELDFDWTGTSVEVSFPEGLKKDLTYTITVGTDVVDRNNNNRMLQSYSFSFATGDKIDRKMISGMVFGKKKEGIFLYAYKLDNYNDTLLQNKPDYVSQSGQNGRYQLNGMASGNYRVFAVDDNFKDLIYQQDQDEIGIAYRDIILTDEDSVFENLNFILFNADTTEPRLLSGVMTDRYHLLVTFNRELEFNSLSSDNFILYDSTVNRQFPLKYFYKGNTKPEESILVTAEVPDIENEVFLFADTLIDLFGNIKTDDFTKIITSERPDTLELNVVSTEPNQNGLVDYIDTQIKIFFDDGFEAGSIGSVITFTDTLGNTVPYSTKKLDDAILVIAPLKELRAEKNYRINIDLSGFVDAAGNRNDSVFTLNFKTISGLDFTGISGKLIAGDTSAISSILNPVLILENTAEEKIRYRKALSSENFEFVRLEPGKYVLWCFLDEDENNEFNYGYPFPFEHSERFYFYPDTLNLKPRWEITDIQFRLK
jgi:hypothetical protein